MNSVLASTTDLGTRFVYQSAELRVPTLVISNKGPDNCSLIDADGKSIGGVTNVTLKLDLELNAYVATVEITGVNVTFKE